MPADRTRPEPRSGEQRFRADLVAYLDSLSMGELAGLLCELPVMTRITLMHELSDRGPAWARLPVTWPEHPDAGHMGRRSLREVLADRRAARSARRGSPPAPLADPRSDPWITGWLARRRLAGAVAERRLAEALRRPTPAPPARLGETQGDPADFLAEFAEGLLDRRTALLRQGQPATAARALAVTEAVQASHAGADMRGWTVDSERLSSLAHDVLGLEEEYRGHHGYPSEQARFAAGGEVLEGSPPARRSPCHGSRTTRASGPRAGETRSATGPPRPVIHADQAPAQGPGPGVYLLGKDGLPALPTGADEFLTRVILVDRSPKAVAPVAALLPTELIAGPHCGFCVRVRPTPQQMVTAVNGRALSSIGPCVIDAELHIVLLGGLLYLPQSAAHKPCIRLPVVHRLH